MEIEIIGLLTLFIVVIVVGVLIVVSFSSYKNLVPSNFNNIYNKFVTTIGFKSPYNLCQSYSGEEVSLQDFQTLLQAIYNGECGSSHANVSLSFALRKSDLQEVAAVDGIALGGKLIFYNISSPLGVGAILVQGDPGQYPLKLQDYVDMYSAGSPLKDTFITVTYKGCDPYDDVCDASCVFKGICDPVCDDGQQHNIPCNLACIIGHDVTPFSNNSIDENNSAARIATGKCNPDCYSNVTNPFGAYDPGCVWKYRNQNDDICDPNSNGVKDGVCDPDCVKSNNICDPDCNGTVYDGNPFGLNDTKCFVCDGTCNGWCSPSCDKNAIPGEPGFDPDCYRQTNSSYFCSGDGICDTSRGENCANSVDCPGGGLTCGDYHSVCCPSASDADVSGCSNTTNIPEGSVCSCGTQCASNQTCDPTHHCCPQGSTWNGTACNAGYDVLVVALESRLKTVYSDDQISQLNSKVNDYIASLSHDGLSGHFLYLDSNETSDLIGSQVTDSGDWNNIAGVLDQLLPKLKTKYLVIIGGYQTFPQPLLDTGACSDPFFNQFPTDDMYANYNKNNMPAIPVGRIPDPNGGDMSVILNALDTYINLHNTGGLDLSDKYSITMAKAWPENGCPIASSGYCFNKDTLNCNGYTATCQDSSASYTTISGHKFFGLLMHGDYVNPQYFADDPCNYGNIFMTSNDVPNLDVKNSVWMLMPCYSAFLENKQQTSDSVPLEFLKDGGAVYFGGTLTQMGGGQQSTQCPDIPGGDYFVGTLYTLIARHYTVGTTIGQAFLQGKIDYSQIHTGDPDTDSCLFRQLHEDLMYGDPTLKIKNI